jgi:orotate phosphoribosyltransferase
MCVLFGNELAKHIMKMVVKTDQKIDVIVSSAYSAINPGYEAARRLRKYFPEIQYKIVEKDKEGNPTALRGGIDPSKNVLVVNELMTTAGGSTWQTKEAVMKCNGEKPAPSIIRTSFVLVHRAKEMYLLDGSPVIPVFHFDMEDFDVPDGEECPYCRAGSEAIKPKDGNNWNIIQGRA